MASVLFCPIDLYLPCSTFHTYKLKDVWSINYYEKAFAVLTNKVPQFIFDYCFSVIIVEYGNTALLTRYTQ